MGNGTFAPPSDDPLKLLPAWHAINAYIFTDPPETRKLVGLFQILNAPPYGLTDGVITIILCAFMIVYQGETTLYREGSLLPEPGIADWEILLRRPELFEYSWLPDNRHTPDNCRTLCKCLSHRGIGDAGSPGVGSRE